MTAGFLLAAGPIVLLTAIGAAGLLAAILDYFDARTLAAHRAAKLISWAETEAAVLNLESCWKVQEGKHGR